MHGSSGRWIMGGLAGLMGLVGLFVAAHAPEPLPYYAGVGFFVFAVLFIFLLIKNAYDALERGPHHH